MCTWILGSIAGSECNSNLLINPGFEASGAGNSPSGWTVWRAPWGSGEIAVTSTTQKVNGVKGLMLTCSSSSFGVYQQVATLPGKAYQLNGWWKGNFPTTPGNTSWYDCELLDGPYDYVTADNRPYDLPTKVCTYDPAVAVWGWEKFSDAYDTAPECKNGTRISSGSVMTVVLKTGGFSSPYGYYDDITLVELPSVSVCGAKTQADGLIQHLSGAIVTHTTSGAFYVQTSNDPCGLRIASNYVAAPGASLDIFGTMNTASNGERYLQSSYVASIAAPPAPQEGIKPVHIGNLDLGGDSTLGYTPSTGVGQRGVTGQFGANNVGLLVELVGRVIQIDSVNPPKWMKLDDGSGMSVRIDIPTGANYPSVGLLVSVEGISSLLYSNSTYHSRLLMKSFTTL